MRTISQCEGGSQNGVTHSTTIRSPSLSHSHRFKADFCSRPKGRQKQPLQCGTTLSVSGISRCVLGRSYTWGPSTEGDPGSGDSYTWVLTKVSWVVRTLGVLPQRGTLGRATLTFQTDSSALPGQVSTSTSVRSTHTMQDPPMTCRGSFVSLDPFGITLERLWHKGGGSSTAFSNDDGNATAHRTENSRRSPGSEMSL